MAKNSEKTGSIQEKMPQLSALELLEMMQEIDRMMSAGCETEEAKMEVLGQIKAVKAIIQYCYPNVAVPRIILDVVSIAEPDRKKHEFLHSEQGADDMVNAVLDFCDYNLTQEWTGYIDTARTIQKYPYLLKIFEDAMSEREKSGNTTLEEIDSTVGKIQEFMSMELIAAALVEYNGDLNLVLLAVRSAQSAVSREVSNMKERNQTVFSTQTPYAEA